MQSYALRQARRSKAGRDGREQPGPVPVPVPVPAGSVPSPAGPGPAPEQHLGPRRGGARLLPRSALCWPRAGGGEGPAGAGAEALLTKQNGGYLLFQALDGSEKGKERIRQRRTERQPPTEGEGLARERRDTGTAGARTAGTQRSWGCASSAHGTHRHLHTDTYTDFPNSAVYLAGNSVFTTGSFFPFKIHF